MRSTSNEPVADVLTVPHCFGSFDDPIRPREHVRRNYETDLLGGFQVDHEVEFGRLLDGKVGGLCAFQNLVNVNSCTPG